MNFECSNCGAALVVSAEQRTTSCPYCASPQIIERAPRADRPDPAFTLGFAVSEQHARERVKGWLKSRGFFRKPEIARAAIVDMRGVYVPAYLYTATAHTQYQAQIGEEYTTTETYTTTDSKGNTQTHTRTVTHTEWRSLAGSHSAYLTDVLVTASRSIANAELEAVEPFDLMQLRRYSPALLSGWIAEEPTLDREASAAYARREAIAKIGAQLSDFMPGDRHTDLSYQTSFEAESFDLCHVPMWVLAAEYDPEQPAVRVIVNGQSGKLVGKAPLSWPRIVVTILVALALSAGLVVWGIQ